MIKFQFSKTSEDFTADPDVILMLEFQNGNPQSFEALMKKYYPRVINFIYRYGLTQDAAEDLAQDIFLKIYQMAASYKPRAKFQTLLFTMVRNSALNAIRDNVKFAKSLDAEIESEEGAMRPETMDDGASTALDIMLENEKSERIQAVINELPENQRSAVLLKRYENMSYEEIAQSLNCSSKAVKSLLNRAKETLKERLADIIK